MAATKGVTAIAQKRNFERRNGEEEGEKREVKERLEEKEEKREER